MKTYNTKLAAFTILEMTIAMLVAAILIGMTYTAYGIVSRSYLSFIGKNKDMENAVQLDKLLKKDFFRASAISGDKHTIVLKTDSDKVTYTFNPDVITRTQGITDTFKVQIVSVGTSFENHPTDDNPTPVSQGLLDDLELTISCQDQNIPYHYHKQYSSVNLFQQYPDAIN